MATKNELLAQAKELGLTVPSSATKPELEALLKSRSGRPAAPLEVDAERIMVQRPAGPFKGGIILNTNGRCAVCNGVGDHVHTTTSPAGEVTEHVHRDEPVAEPDAGDQFIETRELDPEDVSEALGLPGSEGGGETEGGN